MTVKPDIRAISCVVVGRNIDLQSKPDKQLSRIVQLFDRQDACNRVVLRLITKNSVIHGFICNQLDKLSQRYQFIVNFAMFNSPFINSLSFVIGPYQISTSLDQLSLKIVVSSLPDQHQKPVIFLNRMISEQESLHLWVSDAVSPERRTSFSRHVDPEIQNEPSKHLAQKMAEIQSNFRALESRLMELQVPFTKMSRHVEQNPRKTSSLRRVSSREQAPEKIIEQEQHEISKLQMLNNVLQEKLIEKEGQIVSLQKKLFERDDLVQELAEKLMVANTQKEDIFSEYEKILQTTIFSTPEEATKLSADYLEIAKKNRSLPLDKEQKPVESTRQVKPVEEEIEINLVEQESAQPLKIQQGQCEEAEAEVNQNKQQR